MAGFTIFGRSSDSPLFTLFSSVSKELSLPQPAASRSSFHLGEDDAALRKRVISAGFSNAFVWHQKGVWELMDPTRYWIEYVLPLPTFKATLSLLTSTQLEDFKSLLTKRAAELLQRGEPLGYDAVLLIALKSAS